MVEKFNFDNTNKIEKVQKQEGQVTALQKNSVWSSFKSFWSYQIKLELTPYQKKVFQEVSDFWNQEIYFDKGFHLKASRNIEQSPEVKISADQIQQQSDAESQVKVSADSNENDKKVNFEL